MMQRLPKNRRKWNESRTKSKGKGRSTASQGGKYERDKWAPPQPGESGIRTIDGKVHAYCRKKHDGKPCGWNTTHSTSFHAGWSVDPNFKLEKYCPTHEFVLSKSTSAKSKHKPAGTSSADRVYTATEKSDFEALCDSVTTPAEQALMEGVKRILRLN